MLHHCMQIESAADRYVIYWCIWRVQTIDAHGARFITNFGMIVFRENIRAGGLLNQWHVTIDNEIQEYGPPLNYIGSPNKYSLIRARFFFVSVNRVSLILEATRNMGTGLGIVAYLDGNFESTRLFSSRNTTNRTRKRWGWHFKNTDLSHRRSWSWFWQFIILLFTVAVAFAFHNIWECFIEEGLAKTRTKPTREKRT